jgi:hypothetical protein
MAYFAHHHLVIRPEDVWFSILTQLNMYIKAYSERLRKRFVAHEGRKELLIRIVQNSDKPKDLNFGQFSQDMSLAIEEHIPDKGLREWIIPDFTTTTENDKVVASIIFMGAMSNYFFFDGMTGCGLPSVTFLGERSDWTKMLEKLDKIPSLGEEASDWYRLLVPVVKWFIQTFDYPEHEEVKTFWQKILHHDSGGSGQPDIYSRWLTVFSFWDSDGKCIYKEAKEPTKRKKKRGDPRLVLDGVMYGRIRSEDITQGGCLLTLRFIKRRIHTWSGCTLVLWVWGSRVVATMARVSIG